MFAKFTSAHDDKVGISIDPTHVSLIEPLGDDSSCLHVDGQIVSVSGIPSAAVAVLEAALYDRAYEQGKATARGALHEAKDH